MGSFFFQLSKVSREVFKFKPEGKSKGDRTKSTSSV